jgi:hypothetical protein
MAVSVGRMEVKALGVPCCPVPHVPYSGSKGHLNFNPISPPPTRLRSIFLCYGPDRLPPTVGPWLSDGSPCGKCIPLPTVWENQAPGWAWVGTACITLSVEILGGRHRAFLCLLVLGSGFISPPQVPYWMDGGGGGGGYKTPHQYHHSSLWTA